MEKLSERVAIVAKRLAHILDAPGSHHSRLLTIKVEYHSTFFGAFTKLRKTTVGFVVSVRPVVGQPVRMEQLGSHGTDFHEI